MKFEGCYHGHVDSLLVKAGSGALTHGTPDSAGVPKAFADLTITVSFNDLDAVKAAFAANRGEIAAIILEPVPANAGLYLPEAGFLDGLRTLCTDHGTLLIFDEVMTGFRLAPGGAQEIYGITPDLTALGKVIGEACRSVPLADAPTSWTTSRPKGLFTRRARFPEILWPWRRGWRN